MLIITLYYYNTLNHVGFTHEARLNRLRHTCASRLVNKGVDLYVVKEWLGRSTIQVTEKYAHLAPGKLAHAAKVLEAEDEE